MSNNFIDSNKFFKLTNHIKDLFDEWELSIEEVDIIAEYFKRDVINARQNQAIKKNLSALKDTNPL